MTTLPFDKYQVKGPQMDGGFKISFDLPNYVGEELGQIMKQEPTGYLVVFTEEEYKLVGKEGE